MRHHSLKRLLDIVVSSTALVVLSPVLLVVAVAVLLDSGRPVLFLQERVGRGFSRFRIVKFRTMLPAADGPFVTVGGDTRVTALGRILRKTKLDELPQLWSVLIGDMSIVGPRPEVPTYVDMYRDRYRVVLSMRPGITDPASIEFRDEEALLSASTQPIEDYKNRILPAKLSLAEAYVQSWTVFGDMAIVLRTLVAVVARVRRDEP